MSVHGHLSNVDELQAKSCKSSHSFLHLVKKGVNTQDFASILLLPVFHYA